VTDVQAAPFEPDAATAAAAIDLSADDITRPDAPIPQGQALVSAVAAHPALVLLRPETFRPFMDEVRRELAAFVPDVTTTRGREEIVSKAMKVTKSKTAIDAAALRLTESLRMKVKQVNRLREEFCDELEELAQATKKPVKDWKKAEEDRIALRDATLSEVAVAGTVPWGSSSADIDAQIEALAARVFDPDVFREHLGDVEFQREKSLAALERSIIAQREKEAADAELLQLRAEKAKRDAEDAERAKQEKAKADAEAAEKAKRVNEDNEAAWIMGKITGIAAGMIDGVPYSPDECIRELQRRVIPANYAERHQLAIESARAEALENLTEEVREHQEELRVKQEEAEAARVKAAADKATADAEAAFEARLKAQQDEAAAALQAERDRRAAIDAELQAAAARQDEADRARAADQAHREACHKDAVVALMGVNTSARKTVYLSAVAAGAIVDAIVAGSIPRIEMTF
jgi:hypothetical protein